MGQLAARSWHKSERTYECKETRHPVKTHCSLTFLQLEWSAAVDRPGRCKDFRHLLEEPCVSVVPLSADFLECGPSRSRFGDVGIIDSFRFDLVRRKPRYFL